MQTRPTPADTSWFVNDRFGMFIHWGLYAMAARHEWVKMREEIDDERYDVYFRHFDPDLYDPRLWAKAAADAGMKYFVVTTKHHEGFCLWDSDLTDYKAPNTPCGKDLLAPMVEAYRDAGLRVGFYHSLIDWHHPHYDIDGIHPLRNREDIAELNADRDIAKYRETLHGQVRELLTRFGTVDILWFDFSYSRHKDNPDWIEKGWRGKGAEDWHSEELIELIRELQPDVLMNDRLEIDQDIKTPEQVQPREWVKVEGEPVVWEACHTFSGSWGYHRDEMTWKSPEQLVQLLINSVALGGNLLMNVGPTGRGEFDARALAALEVYGKWMRRHSRSIYGCTQSEYTAPTDCRYTQNGNRLYLHVYAWPFKHLHLDGLAGKVEYAQLLNDGSEVRFSEATESVNKNHTYTLGKREGSIILELPVRKPDVVVPVVELFLK